MIAPKMTPPILQPQRWARNGLIPDAYLLRRLVGAQNHLLAYRRKCFARWGNVDTIATGGTGDVNMWRFRCHTGYNATHMEFALGVLPPNAFSAGLTPTLTISVTISGGATSTETLTFADNATTWTDAPNTISWLFPRIAVSAATTYEVLVTSNDFVRVCSFAAYEVCDPPEVDGTVGYFAELAPGIEQPVIDSVRSTLMQGQRAIYKRNGQHLYSFLGDGDGTSPSVTGTTWTNLIDGGTAGPSASTPGIYVSDVSGGGPTLAYRFSDSSAPAIGIVLAVYGQVTTASNGGEVRLNDVNDGVICSLTGITTTLGWHYTSTTLTNLDTISKLDVEIRHSVAANTLRVDALSVYTYEA